MNNWFVFIMLTVNDDKLLAIDNDKSILEKHDIVIHWNLTKEDALSTMYEYSNKHNIKTVNYNQ